MDAPSARLNRKRLLAALNKWLANPPQHPVISVREGQRPAGPEPAFFMEEPRLILMLKGRGTFRTVEHGKDSVFELRPGQALFLAERTWICPIPRVAYQSLGAIFRSDSTRLTLLSRRVATENDRRRVIPEYLAAWNTPATLGERGKHLRALLKHPPREIPGYPAGSCLVRMLLDELAELLRHAPDQSLPSRSIFWQAVSDYLSEHWSDPALSRETLARFFQCHPNHVSRLFRTHAKGAFRSCVNELRLQRSTILLQQPRHNVTEVAHLCGFSDTQYFIRCFRRRFGFTPGRYRKQCDLPTPNPHRS